MISSLVFTVPWLVARNGIFANEVDFEGLRNLETVEMFSASAMKSC